MAQPINNLFTSYKLSDAETLQGSILTHQQKCVIQNEISQVAENIIGLIFDPTNPAKFTQDDSFLKGQMSVLRVMLLRSDESEQAILNQAHSLGN
jgi:hypothetical protein